MLSQAHIYMRTSCTVLTHYKSSSCNSIARKKNLRVELNIAVVYIDMNIFINIAKVLGAFKYNQNCGSYTILIYLSYIDCTLQGLHKCQVLPWGTSHLDPPCLVQIFSGTTPTCGKAV